MTTPIIPPASSFGTGTPNVAGEAEYEVKSLKFSPIMVPEIIIRVLRHCFARMNPEYRWDADPKKTRVIIMRANDTLNDQAIEGIPRIVVSRNSYQMGSAGMNQGLTSAPPMGDAKGVKDSKHMNLITGSFQIIIEGQQEGTVEMLADMASTFLAWMGVHICVTYGLLNFGLPMTVGETQMDKEGTEKFKLIINSGYYTESHYRIKEDSFKLLAVNLTTVLEGGEVPES